MRTRPYAWQRRLASPPLLARPRAVPLLAVTTTAAANRSVTLDDFTFVRTGP